MKNFENQTENKKKKSAKRRFLVLFTFSVVILLLVFAGVLAFQKPVPTFATETVNGRIPVDAELEFDFDWPIAREAQLQISPQVYGSIRYESMMKGNQLARRIVFRPEVTWLPGMTYEVKVMDIKSATFPTGESFSYTFTFTTTSQPNVITVTPDEEGLIRPDTAWNVELDEANDGLAEFEFRFDPPIENTDAFNESMLDYTITPTELLSQGGEYQLEVYRTTLRHLFGEDEVVFRSDPELAWSGVWNVREAPGIEGFEPHGTAISLNSPIEVIFNENVDFDSFKESVSISPELKGSWDTTDYKTITFTPEKFAQETAYTITLAQGLSTFDGGFLEEDSVHTFTTVGPVKISGSTPASGNTGIGVGNNVTIRFDQNVEQETFASHFSINPAVDGKLTWSGNEVTFDPDSPFGFNTTYTISLSQGIVSTNGIDSTETYTVSFATELSVTKLAVPFHRQEHNLSCEIATLVMALQYRGLDVSEATIIDAIGLDGTLHQTDGVWGNPHIAFVGDIDGHQPSTGYGVYWQPIATAAQKYRNAYWFTGWTLSQLTAEIQKGNPVIVWGTAGSGSRIDWKTSDGDNVVAINGEHTRTVIGYIGSADNPTTIITLDPLSGEKYFTKDSFLWNWGLLNNSGVVVE